MKEWYECKVRYFENVDNKEKQVSAKFLVSAISVSDAETIIYAKITELLKDTNVVDSSIEIPHVNLVKYDDVDTKKLFDIYFCAKVEFIEINENGKSQKTTCQYLTNAQSIDEALQKTNELLSNTTIDYRIKSISETNIIDIFDNE